MHVECSRLLRGNLIGILAFTGKLEGKLRCLARAVATLSSR